MKRRAPIRERFFKKVESSLCISPPTLNQNGCIISVVGTKNRRRIRAPILILNPMTMIRAPTISKKVAIPRITEARETKNSCISMVITVPSRCIYHLEKARAKLLTVPCQFISLPTPATIKMRLKNPLAIKRSVFFMK